MSRLCCVLLAWALWLVAASFVRARLGLSRGDYAVGRGGIQVTLAFARRDAAALEPAIDPDRDGKLTTAEVGAGGAALAKRVFAGIEAELGGVACSAEPGEARLVEEDGIEVRGRMACAGDAAGPVKIALPLLDDLATGHRHLAKLARGSANHEAMLHRRERTVSMAAGEPGAAGAEESTDAPAVAAFFVIGIEHILLGWDHVVFLVGLVLVAGFGERRWRGILLAVTAFTIAHSITLGLAVMEVVTPNLGIIEPLIALSVAYVGVENFLVKDPAKRWRVTLPFGLIHGFGFAGALGEVGLPKGQVPAALLLFNLGVEAGQLVLMAMLLPFVFFLAKRAWYRRWGVKVASGLIVAAGLYWFVERVL